MKTENTNRNKWIKVRLSETEFETVKQMAAEAGCTVSEFVRTVLLNRSPIVAKKGLARLMDGNNGERRNTKISINLTDKEREWIDERAVWLGCTPTALVRRLIFSNDDIAPVVIDTSLMKAVYLELHREGVNLNQLMTYLNSYKGNADTSGVAATLKKVNQQIDRIEDAMDKLEAQQKKKTDGGDPA